jgi:hypothetical protein
MRGGLFWYVVEVDFFLIAFPLIKTLAAYHKIVIITQQESILFERLEGMVLQMAFYLQKIVCKLVCIFRWA